MVELGTSDVPLEEDIIKRPIEFVKTWSEWSSNSQQAIALTGTATGIILSISDKETLYITSAYLTGTNTTANSTSTFTMQTTTKNNVQILQFRIANAAASVEGKSNQMSISFNPPLKIEGSDVITVTGTNSTHGLFGWKEQKKIS